jgi:hypothetical protein
MVQRGAVSETDMDVLSHTSPSRITSQKLSLLINNFIDNWQETICLFPPE